MISWDIEVEHAGAYDVEVYYTVPESDVGATVEVSFLDETIEAQMSDAHDPPLVGEAEDRSPRSESYTKDFRPVVLGSMTLAEGRGELRLQATEIPGSQVMEVSALTLRRSE